MANASRTYPPYPPLLLFVILIFTCWYWSLPAAMKRKASSICVRANLVTGNGLTSPLLMPLATS